jgi:hypothetical protein
VCRVLERLHSRNHVFVTEFRPEDLVAGHLRLGAVPVWRRHVGCNLLLSTGSALVAGLISDVDTGVTLTKLNEANANIGVGDGTTAPARAQTGLVGGNTLYRGMDTGYPTWDAVNEQLQYRSLFIDTEAEWVWSEAVLANASSGVCLGRLLFSVPIEKTPGRIWAADYYVFPT